MKLIKNRMLQEIKLTFYTLSIIILIAQITSCRKYLDKKSNNNLVVPTTIDDLQAMLDEASSVMNLGLTPSFGEASSDDYYLPQNLYDERPLREKKVYTWEPADYFHSNDWSKSYGPVYNSNYCLEILEKISRTSENDVKWKNIKGSALFYRSYNFLNLIWNYCKAYDPITSTSDLGIVLKFDIDFNLPTKRSTVSECYETVIRDAKESLIYLPDFPFLTTLRPSKAAAYGLLARTYLSMRIYDSAFKYSDLCLQLKSDLIDYKNSTADPDVASNITTGNAFVFRQFNRETIFYTEMNTTNPTIATARAKIDSVLFSYYTNSDLRRNGFTRADATDRRFRGSYAGSLTAFFSGIATDEMYLIKAESLSRGVNGGPGDKDAAMAVLNTLLRKRHTSAFVDLTSSSATEALDFILLERRKELVMRGLRWIDIKRLNKEGRNIIPTRFINGQIYTLQPNANYYALPLPTDIINLSGMPQNPQ